RPMPLPADRLHDVLASASLVVGDSQSVITEAALLGTPAVRINSWVGATPYLNELEERYQLVRSFHPDALEAALGHIEGLLADAATTDLFQQRRSLMLNDKVNLTDWYVDLALAELAR